MIVGVDISSKRIDLAWLEAGKPRRWHQGLGDPKKVPLIDRLRAIDIRWPRPASSGVVQWIGDEGADVTDIAIEYPFARGNAIPALWSTMGAITRQAPTWARVAWPRTGDLRKAIGCGDNKYDAGQTIKRICWPDTWEDYPPDWDEHELDALVACLGWTRILAQQDAA